MQQISNTISISSSLTPEQVQQALGNRVLVRIPNKTMLTTQPVEGQDNALKNYVDTNHLIVFIDDVGQLYVDGHYYGISQDVVQGLINDAVSDLATNVAQEILKHETSITLVNNDHLLIEQTGTAYEDPETHEITYISPKEYTITLKDVASQAAFNQLVTYTTTYTDESTGETETITHTITNLKTSLDEAARTAVAEVVDGAPAAFDTLKEISDWINSTGEAAGQVGQLLTTVSQTRDRVDELESFSGIHYTYDDATGTYSSTSDWPYTKTVTDPDTQTETTVPLTLKEIVEQNILGYGSVGGTYMLLADDEFVTQENPNGTVPYQTITDLNVALAETAYDLRGVINKTVEDGAQKNKVEVLTNTDTYLSISAGTAGTDEETTYTINMNMPVMTAYIDSRIDERLAWSLLTTE